MGNGGFDNAARDAVLRTHDQSGVLVIGIRGEVDLGTVTPIAHELIGLVARRPEAVVIDAQAVTFLGSVGITMLLDTQQYAEQLGIPLATATANRAVLRPLRLSGVDDLLQIHDTLPGAVSAVREQIG